MRHLQKLFFPLLSIVAFLFTMMGSSYAQQIQYPIPQLGNCRDVQECFYYCDIPRNTPACWSYGRYILGKDVLGDTTKSPDQIAKEHGITFPIPELGNCNSPQACMQYCNIPTNQQACTDFGRKKALIKDNGNNQQSAKENQILLDAKTQLGCASRESCVAFCNDPVNQQKCQAFTQNEGLTQNIPQPTIPLTIFQATIQELGCNSKETCMYYCSIPNHYQKCKQFAQEHNLIPPQIQPSIPISGMPTPPCSDQTSCMQWCKDNPQQCQSFKQQYYQNQYHGNNTVGMPQPQGTTVSTTFMSTETWSTGLYQATSSASGGCTTVQECYQYCQQHPSQCPGFQQNNQTFPPSGFINQPHHFNN